MAVIKKIRMLDTVTEAPSAKDRRWSFVVAGPGGTGKSWLLGTMAKQYKTLVIATLPRELDSHQYLVNRENVRRILLEDPEWKPFSEQQRLNTIAGTNFLKLVEELRDDTEYDAVIVDSGTELAEFMWHAACGAMSVAAPSQITDKRSRWLPYETMAMSLDQGIKELTALTKVAARPKFVGISWHVQAPKDDTVEFSGSGDAAVRQTKVSADHSAEGLEYEGKVLPAIRGQYRRRLIDKVEAFVYTEVTKKLSQGSTSLKNMRHDVEYKIQVRPDEERHTKIPGPLPDVKYIPNDFQALAELVNAGLAASEDEEAAAEVAPAAPRKSSLSRK